MESKEDDSIIVEINKKQKVEIKHSENLVSKLVDRYESGKLCDVTLIAGVNKRR